MKTDTGNAARIPERIANQAEQTIARLNEQQARLDHVAKRFGQWEADYLAKELASDMEASQDWLARFAKSAEKEGCQEQAAAILAKLAKPTLP